MEEILTLPLKFHHLKNPQEGRGKKEEQEGAIPPPPIPHHPVKWDNEELGEGWPLPLPLLLLRGKGKGKKEGGRDKGELKLLEMLVIDLQELE